MEFVLMALAGAGLAGCFGAVLKVDMSGRGLHDSRRLRRPRASGVARERAA